MWKLGNEAAEIIPCITHDGVSGGFGHLRKCDFKIIKGHMGHCEGRTDGPCENGPEVGTHRGLQTLEQANGAAQCQPLQTL
ncbi:hypothetical protein GCM10023158_19870 [Gluconacetobacter tumulicola]